MPFSNFFSTQNLLNLLFLIPIFLISLSVHEYCHGYVAYRLGDDTAKYMGRLTLNPIRHIDVFGLLMVIFVGFGWAKPVPVNPNRFKKPRQGMAITAAAGPLSNLCMALIGVILLNALKVAQYYTVGNAASGVNIFSIAGTFLYYFSFMNFAMMILNLIPIPPLDGYRIASYFLPDKIYFALAKIEQFSFVVLFALIFLGIGTLISDGANALFNGVDSALVSLISLFIR